MKKLFKLVLVGAIVAAVGNALMSRKAKFRDMSEDEFRGMLARKLKDRVPEEKLPKVQDKIVAKMRSRGLLRGEAASTA